MRFLLLVCADSTYDPPATMGDETEAWVAEAERRGMRRDGAIAAAPADAVTLHAVDGRIEVVRGRRVAADEQIVGFDLMEADTLEAMIDLVGRHPMTAAGRIEIRPLLDD